jgi:hypothetical protein
VPRFERPARHGARRDVLLRLLGRPGLGDSDDRRQRRVAGLAQSSVGVGRELVVGGAELDLQPPVGLDLADSADGAATTTSCPASTTNRVRTWSPAASMPSSFVTSTRMRRTWLTEADNLRERKAGFPYALERA